MRVIALPTAVFIALYTACSSASPIANGVMPSNFVLAPLYTPSPPPKPLTQDDGADEALTTNGHIVRDSYLVVLHDHLEDHEIDAHHEQVSIMHTAESQQRHLRRIREHGADFMSTTVVDELHGIKHRFDIGGKQNKKARKQLKGYSGKFSESTLDAIRSMKGVKYVERDSIVHAYEIERDAPWGLARISHRKPLSFGTFNKYEYDGHGGEGVDVYVIDTGINVDHVEFEGRARWGKTIPNDADVDGNGHGSHCAGTIGSRKYGVAKKANLVAVKVLGSGGSGTMSDVVAGVSWAADSAYKQAKKNDSKHRGSVASMSLGGGKSQALDDAINSSVEDGLHFAVAAGNDNRDACAYSPAAAEGAITVGASTVGDERAYFSNHGKCVDIFAPGLNIKSVWNTGPTSTNTISGTSMACPHVAGLAAYFLSLAPDGFNVEEDDFNEETYGQVTRAAQVVFGRVSNWLAPLRKSSVASKGSNKPISPAALKKAIQKIGTKGVLTDLPTGSPNNLIFNNYTSPALAIEAMRASIQELDA